jgi:hypothetical protein
LLNKPNKFTNRREGVAMVSEALMRAINREEGHSELEE